MSQHLVVFKNKNIRRVLHQNEWYFSVVDVVAALTDSANPRRYWSDLKIQLHDNEGFSELYGKIVQLKLEAPDGKMRETDCTSTELKSDAKAGGEIAGGARRELEKRLGRSVVSKSNFLPNKKIQKTLKGK